MNNKRKLTKLYKMKTTINIYDFRTWFENNRPNNFSYSGLTALFEYFEEYEHSTGESIEFDPISICCEYTEYENLKGFYQDYDEEDFPTMQSIEENTQVIPFGKESFIIIQF